MSAGRQRDVPSLHSVHDMDHDRLPNLIPGLKMPTQQTHESINPMNSPLRRNPESPSPIDHLDQLWSAYNPESLASAGDRHGITGEAAAGWQAAYDQFKRQDERIHRQYREEVDTSLVFAGLFSAVVTAFVVEAYRSLQDDPAQTAIALMQHMSNQLSNSNVGAFNPPTSFQPSAAAVRVNICWFVSLVLSLTAALFGFLLKQWMENYVSWTQVSPPQDAVALRQLRYEGVVWWKLQTIRTAQPVLLQLSLLLFMGGLVQFLWPIHPLVAHVLAAIVGLCLLAAIVATFLPLISPSCPFRGPLSAGLARIRIQVSRSISRITQRSHQVAWVDDVPHSALATWIDVDAHEVIREDAKARKQPTLVPVRLRAILELHSSTQDPLIISGVRPCMIQPSSDYKQHYIPMSHCWHVILAMLNLPQTKALSKVAGDWEECSRRALRLSSDVRRCLLELVMESIGSDANHSRESEATLTKSALTLMSHLIREHGGLIPRYVSILMRLLVRRDHALEHLDKSSLLFGVYSVACVVDELQFIVPCARQDAIALLDIATTATSHVMNPASARTNPPETIKFLWELSLRLAANVRLDEDDGSGKDSLLSLLTAIGECAPEELSIDFAATTWFFFHPSCWHAIHVFMRRSREFLPLSFVMFIYRCLNIQTEPSGILTEVEWNWLIESTAWCSTVVTPRTRYLDSAHIFH